MAKNRPAMQETLIQFLVREILRTVGNNPELLPSHLEPGNLQLPGPRATTAEAHTPLVPPLCTREAIAAISLGAATG